MEYIGKLIHETIKSGIGQAIIAFSAWGYVAVLFIVVIFYFISLIIKLLHTEK